MSEERAADSEGEAVVRHVKAMLQAATRPSNASTNPPAAANLPHPISAFELLPCLIPTWCHRRGETSVKFVNHAASQSTLLHCATQRQPLSFFFLRTL